MSLSTNVGNLATAVATNAKAMKVLINGNALDLSALTTVSKANLVAAINEIAASVAGAGASIVDAAPSTTSVWSSSKTNTSITAAVAGVLNAAPAALDTLNELAVALGNDPNFATTIATSIGSKAPLASPAFTGTPTGITKVHVGLANVDNTTDLLKPLSTAAGVESAAAKARANHTGTQVAATVSDFSAASDARIAAQKGLPSGLASLDAGTKLPVAQIPTGATGTTVALGNDARFTDARTPSNDAALAHLAGAETISGVKNFTAQPTGIVKASVGLANVDNTTDALKPISTAQALVNTAQATANGSFALGSEMGNTATDFVAAFNAGLV
jgi:hypothetical protein